MWLIENLGRHFDELDWDLDAIRTELTETSHIEVAQYLLNVIYVAYTERAKEAV